MTMFVRNPVCQSQNLLQRMLSNCYTIVFKGNLFLFD